MSGLPERDPLADLVARSVGARVDAVTAEQLSAGDGIERRRLRYETSAGPQSAIFERRPKGDTVEAQLLPFLTRKTARVPKVYSRGLPPPHASLGPWILFEDVLGSPAACDEAVVDVLRAKLEIERAVVADVPALRALGLVELHNERFAGSPIGLVHGALTCAAAHRTARGVVIVGWSAASIGPTLLDAISLIADTRRRGHDAAAHEMSTVLIREEPDATKYL